jgi:hypothetical protein
MVYPVTQEEDEEVTFEFRAEYCSKSYADYKIEGWD